MAAKIDAPGKADRQAIDELETLSPERHLQIAGKSIEMREPSWLESLEYDPKLAPVIAAVEDELGTDNTPPCWGAMARLMFRHRDVLLDFMALCAGVDRAWIEKLNEQDGNRLAALFWAVNGHFFGRRVRMRRVEREVAERGGRMSAQH